MLNRKQSSELLSQALDRPITFRERLVLRPHLLICDGRRNNSPSCGKQPANCRENFSEARLGRGIVARHFDAQQNSVGKLAGSIW